MNLDTLRVFCDVVSCKNFSRGGAMNDISQSAASQAVHQLERHLGVRLIDRSKRPLLVTPEGQACYEVYRNILDQFDDLTSRVRTRSTEITGAPTTPNNRINAI